MALLDDKNYTTVGTNWVLLLEGEGIITNMDIEDKNIKFRFDTVIPSVNDVSRTIYGKNPPSNKDSFINYSADSKIYGRAKSGTVKVLVTKEVV